MSNYLYLMSFLPGLDGVDGVCPIKVDELLEQVSEIGGPAKDAVEFIIMRRDIEILEALAYEPDSDRAEALYESGLLFSREQFSGVDTLPDWLVRPMDSSPVALQALWRSYFSFGLQAAQDSGSKLLETYIAWEVTLRNTLASERASITGASSPEQWLLDAEVGNKYTRQDFLEIIARWKQESSPLESEKILDEARWQFVELNTPFFSFEADEVVGYALKLVIVDRWNSLIQERGEKILEEIAG